MSVTLRDLNGNRGLIFAFEQVGQADSLEGVARTNFGVVRLVDEPQRQDALFLKARVRVTSV